jgi:hypothetical protein
MHTYILHTNETLTELNQFHDIISYVTHFVLHGAFNEYTDLRSKACELNIQDLPVVRVSTV